LRTAGGDGGGAKESVHCAGVDEGKRGLQQGVSEWTATLKGDEKRGSGPNYFAGDQT